MTRQHLSADNTPALSAFDDLSVGQRLTALLTLLSRESSRVMRVSTTDVSCVTV